MANWLAQNAPMYEALYDFAAEEEGELSMQKGVKYQLAPGDDGIYGNDDDAKDGWILVMDLKSGESGFVPVDYVKKISAPAPKGAASPKRSMAPNPVVIINGKAESIDPSMFSGGMGGHGGGPTLSPALSLQDLAGDVGDLTSSAPIRRLSDPRLQEKLLASIDSSVATSSTSFRKASSRTPPASSRSKPTVTISTPITPKTPSSNTPITNRKMSTRAQAAASRKASMRKASMMSSPRAGKVTASSPADRALFR